MAVAARPGPSDARVPCPLCGGLVHPIAGKCKHCKAELTGYHAARPAASTPLPSLHKPAAANGHSPQTNGHAAHAPIAAAAAAAVATAQEVQPVLPPRPTTRSHTAEPATTAWRSWPVLVIVLAMLAIVAAVVLMVWPAAASRAGDAGKRLMPPPAPDRMPTTVPEKPTVPDRQPTVPDRHNKGTPPRAAAPDPWAPGAVVPSPPDPAVTPDTDDQDDDLSFTDPLSDPHAPRGRRLNRRGTLFATMFVHVCRKMIACGLDDPMVTSQCDQFARAIPAPLPNCPAATRCYQHIDAMACGSQPTTLARVGQLLRQFSDCSDAIRC